MMAKCWARVPRHQFQVLSTRERILLVCLVCAAISINSWLLSRNLQRMWEAQANPVSRISQYQVTTFPDFVIAIQINGQLQAGGQPDCTEQVLFPNGTLKKTWSCPSKTVRGVDEQDFIVITPLSPFFPSETLYYTGLIISYTNLLDGFSLCVMDPKDVQQFIYDAWSPPDGCYGFAADDTQVYEFGLDASAIQYPNQPKSYSFTLNEIQADSNHSFIFFASDAMNPLVSLNTLSVSYLWTDVLSSNASVLSLSFTVFTFLFPLGWPGKPQFRFRFRFSASSPSSALDDLKEPLNRFEPQLQV